MSLWTDAHCHLQERYLSGDPQVAADVADTLTRAHEAGVGRVIVVDNGYDSLTILCNRLFFNNYNISIKNSFINHAISRNP